MMDELRDYYSDELDYLRRMGAEFARRYERVARRLALKEHECGDPHVERLLEGVALLTARVRRKIDDEFPEITNALLGLLHPDFQRPVPSLTVLQFALKGASAEAAQGIALERGLRLRTREVQGVACRFLTNYPVMLWPIEVAAARLESSRVVETGMPGDTLALLRITLKTLGGARFGALGLKTDGERDRLRFYLDGSGPVPYFLHEFLLNHVSRVQVRDLDNDGRVAFTWGPDVVQPVGFGPDEGLVPIGPRTFPGHRLLQEYFVLPEKFLFVDLVGASRLAQANLGESIELLFFLNRAPRTELIVGPENFRLGCTPAVNLFPLTTAAIPLTHRTVEYPVVPDLGVVSTRPKDRGADTPTPEAEVFSIDRVVSVGGLFEDDLEYEPFYSLRHAGLGDDDRDRDHPNDRAAYWYASRRPSPLDDAASQVFLAFVDSAFDPHLPARSRVTVHATCTNRNLPSRLPSGDGRIAFDVESPQAVGAVRCLRHPTPSLDPPLGRGAQWRLISCLALNHLSLVDDPRALEALREVLKTHDFAGTAANTQAILGISRVASEPDIARVSGPHGGGIGRGVRVTIEFDEGAYVGNSAFLLASVLDRFLAQSVTINGFTRLLAKARQPQRTIKQWPPRNGERDLL